MNPLAQKSLSERQVMITPTPVELNRRSEKITEPTPIVPPAGFSGIQLKQALCALVQDKWYGKSGAITGAKIRVSVTSDSFNEMLQTRSSTSSYSRPPMGALEIAP